MQFITLAIPKLASTNLEKPFDKENNLFFQVGFDMRYRHWIAYHKVELGVDIHAK